MANPYFQFKQFTVFHDQCAMKVGTDGVLLGAWSDCSRAKNILDVGTGSGLIALMLAQRSGAEIDALEIDEDACKQARYNIENSKFRDRIKITQSDFNCFETDKRYDLIVSNPPFFSNSLQAPDKKRNLARHNHALSFETLITKSADFLTGEGKIALILPYEACDEIQECACNCGLFLCRKTTVHPKPDVSPKRILLEYSKTNTVPEISAFFIEENRHIYSEEFKKLTWEFYLKN